MSALTSNIKQAFKLNLIPALCLQAFAILLAIAYFKWPAAAPTFNYFADLKQQYGWLYSMLSTALFGGLIPFLFLWATGQITHSLKSILTFYCVFWAIKGTEVNYFYTVQSYLFGDVLNWQTLLTKTAFDQLIYSALWAVPSMAISFLWMESGFSFRRTKNRVDRDFFFLQIPTTLISNWLIWLPAVIVIYSMPPALQIPLFNLVLCFFVLLLSAISKSKQPTEVEMNPRPSPNISS